MTKLTVWREIVTNFNGRAISGSYAIEHGMVIVRAPHGEEATRLGGPNPIWLAARLLRELATEGKAQNSGSLARLQAIRRASSV